MKFGQGKGGLTTLNTNMDETSKNKYVNNDWETTITSQYLDIDVLFSMIRFLVVPRRQYPMKAYTLSISVKQMIP